MKRIQISLRLMFVLVAMFTVYFAWIGAERELRRMFIQGERQNLEFDRAEALRCVRSRQPYRHQFSLAKIEVEISEKRAELGDSC